MQVRLVTTVTTVIDLLPGVTYEEAKGEIFAQYADSLEVEAASEEIALAQSNCVQFDEVKGTETTHTFEEVK